MSSSCASSSASPPPSASVRARASACIAWPWSGSCRPSIAGRPKHGFSTPYDDWLRASLGEEVERRYAAGSPLSELVAPRGVQTLVDEHRRGRFDHKSILYCLLELSEWHRAFVEAREPVPA